MRNQKTWRVRVKRSIEDWVAVQSDTPLQAEQLAATVPGVLSVFGQSAILGDRPVEQAVPAGIMDEDE